MHCGKSPLVCRCGILPPPKNESKGNALTKKPKNRNAKPVMLGEEREEKEMYGNKITGRFFS
jgi:hypothetical protein